MPRKITIENHVPAEPPIVTSMDFENAVNELEMLIQAVENNRLPLEATLSAYQRGQLLIGRCNTLLQDAEQRLEQYAAPQKPNPIDPESA